MPSTTKHVLVAAACLIAFPTIGHALGNPVKNTLAEFGEDMNAIKVAGAKLYESEDVPVGTIEEWANPASGGAGTVELVEIFEHEGLPCRKLLHMAKPGKSADPKRFTITRCRTADGTWKIL